MTKNQTARYTIVLERTNTGYSVYSPDIVGCVATGSTEKETEANMRDAVNFHLEGLLARGYPIPQPSTTAKELEITLT